MVRIDFLRIMAPMLAQQFVYWCETASAAERCAAVAMLADAVVNRKFLPGDLREAEAALMIAAEDPSPRVRHAIAEGMAASGKVPRQLVRLLSKDVDDVAVPIIVLSPILSVEDLCDLVRTGRPAVCLAVAQRLQLPAAVAAELVAGGDAVACLELARNQTASLEGDALRRLVEQAAEASELRFALLQRGDLPAGLRHALLSCLGDALCRSALVANIVGPARAERMRGDLHEQATASMIDTIKADELSAFVEQLRGASQLNAAVLVRAVCMGRIDLFAASMARLTGLSDARVRSVIADAREPAFMALASAAGLPRSVVPLLLSAVRVWKDMASDDRFDHADIASSVMERVVIGFRKDAGATEADELSHLLHRMSCEMQQASARRRTDRYLAA